MRTFLFLIALFALSSLTAQGLKSLPPDADPAAFSEALEEHMNASGNKTAKDAYANFAGVFFGGGFTPEQQNVIRDVATELANRRVSSATGGALYLDLLAFMTGTAEAPNPLFASFHQSLQGYLANEKLRANDIVMVLSKTEQFLRTRRLSGEEGKDSWIVIGGATDFEYDGEHMIMRLDTVRQLVASGRNDTIYIDETDLRMNLQETTVSGRGGRVDWKRVGLGEDVFAILVRYDFDLRRMTVTSDSAQLQFPDYFDNKILVGSFADKLAPGGAKSSGEYPQFLSEDGFVEISNVGKGIDLMGNFEMRGGTVFAIGAQGRRAQVTLGVAGDDGTQKVRALGARFAVKSGETVAGQNTATTIYFGEDSLYHPDITMRVDIAEQLVKLSRSGSGDESPYMHSLNNMRIQADHIDIYLAQDSAVVGRKTVSFEEKPDVIFESADYFSENDYYRIQDIASSNPLDIIWAYRNGPEGGNDLIDADQLARQFDARYNAGNIQSMLFSLQSQGFLRFDSEAGEVRLLPKLGHYIQANREEIDYDRLRLRSQSRGVNAIMNLKTGEVRLNDVLPVEFNRKKQIAIKPLGDQVTLQGDRNFDFSGDIYAGGMVFTGKDFRFEYEPYRVKLDSVRYFDLFLPVDDQFGEGMRRESTGSRIEHLSGYLLIDAPKNKSGTEDIAYFPSLQSKGPSFIYYDQADTNAVYTRDSFYFELAPFSLNGMDSLIAPQVELDGRLVSGGIFPDMNETLTIQEDGSLGFITQTAAGGQGAYGERGAYEGEVVLSNRGLEGKGKLTYLEANIESEDIRFELDKTRATSRSFALEETQEDGREIPQVKGSEVNIEFKPYGDSLLVNAAEDAPFEMFKSGEHQFQGGLVLTPEALKANGELTWSQAAMTSSDIDFTVFGANADTANVAINSLESDERLALQTKNVSARVDFNTQVAAFENNSTDLATSLPYNQFKTSIDRFDWNMASGNVVFQAKPGKDRFTSTNPAQDELTFTGSDATYDINTSMLEVAGVPFVISADAKIFPGDSSLQIQPGGVVTQLTNARIVADTINEYHVIEKATVDIVGRKDYTASGFYQYNIGPHQQEVEFQKIVGSRVGKGKRQEKATATRADGEVAQGTTFFIDHKTRFYGTINLDAGSKTLLFDGFAKIEDEALPGAQWFTIQSEGDKKNLMLKVKQPKDREGLPLFTGIYLSKPNRQIYPSFVQTLDFRKDHPLLDANEAMLYDEVRDVFLFGDSSRVHNPALIGGNLMELDLKNRKVSGDGLLGLGGRLKYVSFKSYGTVKMDLPEGSRVAPEPEPEPVKTEEPKEADTPNMFVLENETESESETADSTATGTKLTIDGAVTAAYPDVDVMAMAAIDLILPNKLLNIMATDFLSSSFSNPGINIGLNQTFYTTGIKTLFPDGKEKEAALAALAGAVFNVDPKINKHTFLFSDLKFRWSRDNQSFMTTEKLNGLASVRGNPVAKVIESHAEVKMTTGGEDRLYLYVKSPSELYYWFGFKDGVLNVYSNNTQFMNELENMKAKELVLEMDDKETYEILPVSSGTVQRWLERIKTAF